MIELRVKAPKAVDDRIKELGMDVESLILDLLVKEFGLDPNEEARVHAELALTFLEERLELVDKDPI